jgi:hypothetical protein
MCFFDKKPNQIVKQYGYPWFVDFCVKNVILYNPYGTVVGFCELRNQNGATAVTVKHNLNEPDLITTINNEICGTEIRPALDLSAEVMACIVKKTNAILETVASGIINPREVPVLAGVASHTAAQSTLKKIINETRESSIDRQNAVGVDTANPVKEIDEVLRAVCMLDGNGKGLCQLCPYREFFYGEDISI